MHRNVHVALSGAALTLGAVVALPGLALAQQVTVDCPAGTVTVNYAQVCAEVPARPVTPVTPGTTGGTAGTTTDVAATARTTGTTRGAVSTLPFTGDELLVLSLAGAGALAAGGALVAAGRRRSPSA